MEKFRLHVGIPSSGFCRTQFAVSLAGLVGYFATNKVHPDVQEQSMCVVNIESSCIPDNRERLVMNALQQSATHILFIDDDMSFDVEALMLLIGHNVPIVGCNYPFRSPHGGFTALCMDQQTRLVTAADSSGLVEVNYSGFGFCLIDLEVFKRVPQPWFQVYWHPEMQRYSTEDQPFAEKCRQAGYRWFVSQDASKRLKHIGLYEYRWDSPIIAMQPALMPFMPEVDHTPPEPSEAMPEAMPLDPAAEAPPEL